MLRQHERHQSSADWDLQYQSGTKSHQHLHRNPKPSSILRANLLLIQAPQLQPDIKQKSKDEEDKRADTEHIHPEERMNMIQRQGNRAETSNTAGLPAPVHFALSSSSSFHISEIRNRSRRINMSVHSTQPPFISSTLTFPTHFTLPRQQQS
ncbi:hypothetical protein VTO58DRAFT_103860 [Aureobasidium pullulans]